MRLCLKHMFALRTRWEDFEYRRHYWNIWENKPNLPSKQLLSYSGLIGLPLDQCLYLPCYKQNLVRFKKGKSKLNICYQSLKVCYSLLFCWSNWRVMSQNIVEIEKKDLIFCFGSDLRTSVGIVHSFSETIWAYIFFDK